MSGVIDDCVGDPGLQKHLTRAGHARICAICPHHLVAVSKKSTFETPVENRSASIFPQVAVSRKSVSACVLSSCVGCSGKPLVRDVGCGGMRKLRLNVLRTICGRRSCRVVVGRARRSSASMPGVHRGSGE